MVGMQRKLPTYKERFAELTIAKMKQELADEALESKWKELNMGIDQWKHKYLYPFGNIEPIKTKETIETVQTTQASSRMQPEQSIFSAGSRSQARIQQPYGQQAYYNDPTRPQDSIFLSEESKFLSPNLG